MRRLVVLPPIMLSLLLVVSAVGCVKSGSTEIDHDDNATRANTTTDNVVSTNISPLPTSQINPSLLNPLWTNANVFIYETNTINVDVGERFIIRYDYHGIMFGHFDATDYPKDVVAFLGSTPNSSGAQPVDGVIWFFFQAKTPGFTRITIREFGHLTAIAPLSQRTFLVNVGKQDPSTIPPPGKSANESARVLYAAYSVDLKAGETKSVDVTLETRKDGPGWFRCEIFRTDKDGNNTLAMPNGLVVSIDPRNTAAYPNNTYNTTINIKTSPDLVAGQYWLRFEGNFEQVFKSTGWLVVTVR